MKFIKKELQKSAGFKVGVDIVLVFSSYRSFAVCRHLKTRAKRTQIFLIFLIKWF